MSTSADRWTRLAEEMNVLAAHMRNTMHRRVPPVTCNGGQHGIDIHLAKYMPPGDGGTYVDVGANHPIECSNTWQYYKAGWRGLLIEPYPDCWYGLLRHRQGDILEPIAAMPDHGMNILRLQGTVSSFKMDWNIQEQGNLAVETEPLHEILSRHPEIRDRCKLCSVDTEGTEPEVLSSIDWHTFRPDVFVVEYATYNPTGPGEDQSSRIAEILIPQGYQEVFRDQLNIIYKRP